MFSTICFSLLNSRACAHSFVLQKYYHLGDVFKVGKNSANSFSVNQTKKFSQLKFWAGLLLEVTSIVKVKKIKRIIAKAESTISSTAKAPTFLNMHLNILFIILRLMNP